MNVAKGRERERRRLYVTFSLPCTVNRRDTVLKLYYAYNGDIPSIHSDLSATLLKTRVMSDSIRYVTLHTRSKKKQKKEKKNHKKSM